MCGIIGRRKGGGRVLKRIEEEDNKKKTRRINDGLESIAYISYARPEIHAAVVLVHIK